MKVWVAIEFAKGINDDGAFTTACRTLYVTNSKYYIYHELWCYLFEMFKQCYNDIKGFRNLFYTQIWNMLDTIDDYLLSKNWDEPPPKINFSFNIGKKQMKLMYIITEHIVVEDNNEENN